MLRLAALDGQVTSWLDTFGPILFYAIVWALVFAGTGLFVGAFIPFITGDSLLFDSGALHGPEKLTSLPMTFLSIITFSRATA